MEAWELSAVDLVAALRRRELSAPEALQSVLERADAIAPALNPFAERLDDRARRTAIRADHDLGRGDAGPLAGVPITIKDSHWLAGVPSPSGSPAKRDFVPDESSAAVERLEAAGALIYATTTTPEFCFFGVTESPLHGVSSNPWDPQRTPGGSSGGAGAAVAAGAGPLALGGDGGGSIRIPAAFCGTVGFKPTFGLVPREPCGPTWKSLVSYGPMARTVADARLMLGAMAGMDARDRHSIEAHDLDRPPPRPPEMIVAASVDLGFAPVDEDVAAAFERTVERLDEAGARIVWDEPGLDSSVGVWAVTAAADAFAAEGELLESQPDEVSPAVAEFLRFGRAVPVEEYLHAQAAREHIHRAYADLFARTGADVLLTPAVGCEAFPHGRRHPEQIGGVAIEPPWLDWAGFLYDGNLCGLPACALPMGLGDDGLPLSLQVLGLRGNDGTVLAYAEAIERLLEPVGWPQRALDSAPAE